MDKHTHTHTHTHTYIHTHTHTHKHICTCFILNKVILISYSSNEDMNQALTYLACCSTDQEFQSPHQKIPNQEKEKQIKVPLFLYPKTRAVLWS
jgi:hypothetical protein